KGIYWNPMTGEFDKNLLEGADVVINLSGESIFGRWSHKKKERIEKSRLIPAEFLTEMLLTLKNPPRLYIGASAIGFYGNRGKEVLTETSSPGACFLADLCTQLEKIPERLSSKNIRTVTLRLGIVLGEGGGALAKMKTPFKMGLGGILGNGKQY